MHTGFADGMKERKGEAASAAGAGACQVSDLMSVPNAQGP